MKVTTITLDGMFANDTSLPLLQIELEMSQTIPNVGTVNFSKGRKYQGYFNEPFLRIPIENVPFLIASLKKIIEGKV